MAEFMDKISVGSAETAVARARRERQEREERRKKEQFLIETKKHALRIWIFWLRYKLRRRFRNRVRKQYGVIVDKHARDDKTRSCRSLVAETELLRVIYSTEEKKKLCQTCEAWLSCRNVVNTNGDTIELGLVDSKLARRTRDSLLFLGRECFQVILGHHIDTGNTPYLSGVELRFLILNLDPNLHRNPHTQQIIWQILSQLSHLILPRFMESIITRIEARFFADTKQSNSIGLWLTSATHLALLLAQSVSRSTNMTMDKGTETIDEDGLMRFAMHMLSAPILIPNLDSQGVTLLLTKHNILGQLEHLPRDGWETLFNTMSAESLVFLVVNIISICRVTNSPPSATTILLFLRILERVEGSLPRSNAINTSHNDSTKTFSPLLGWHFGTSRHLSKRYHDAIMEEISCIYANSTISTLLKDVINWSTYTTKDEDRNLAVRTRNVLHMYSLLSRVLQGQRQQATNNGKILLKSANHSESWKIEFYVPMLDMTCEMLRLSLMTVDTEDLKTGRFITMEDLNVMSDFINFLVYTQLQNDIDCQSCIQLLRLLNDRMLKAESEWVMKECSTKRFTASLRSMDSTAMKILNVIPWSIPFATRVEVLRTTIQNDKSALSQHKPIKLTIRRGQVLSDGLSQLGRIAAPHFKQRFHVTFINEMGLEESGIDRFGLFKEFFSLLLKECLSPDFGLFMASPAKDGSILPSRTCQVHENWPQLYEFIGKVMGKAVYEGIVVDIPFPVFFYKKLTGGYNSFDDLPFLDPDLHKNLLFLKHYDGDAADLGLTFSVTEEVLGSVTTTPLKFNGGDIAVTNSNKHEYIHLMADNRLNLQFAEQVNYFLRGFRGVVGDKWLTIFSCRELQKLVSGDGEWSVAELRKCVKYEGVYFDAHPTIRSFWRVVGDMTLQDKEKLLRFITGCSKPPIGGFEYLHPPFTIRYVEPDPDSPTGTTPKMSFGSALLGMFGLGGKDTQRLPTSATCFNLLKLPAYNSERTLRERLFYAINSGAGFELL